MLRIAEQPYVKYGAKEERKLWECAPNAGRAVLKKIERILAAATRRGHRAGESPAQWAGHLAALLPAPQRVQAAGRQPALPCEQLPAFMAALRRRAPSPSSSALQFLILTAARSGEVRKATWSEIDLARGLWTIPAERMKAGRDHRVALPEAAQQLLKATPPVAGTDLIWPGKGLREPLSDMTVAALVKKLHAAEVKAGSSGWLDPRSGKPAVPQGFRPTFRDWAAEQTAYPAEMAELALAHEVGSAVERAYRRGEVASVNEV